MDLAMAEGGRLERLAARCGPSVHLLVDTLLVGHQLLLPPPAARSAQLSAASAGDAARWLTDGPLWEALQLDRPAQCGLCSPQGPLTVRGVSRVDVSNESRTAMVQLGGPFGWTAGEEDISPQEAPRLRVVPTERAGFVMLQWARTSRCEHSERLTALPADQVRRLMWHHCRVLYPDDCEITMYGPAVNVRHPDDADFGTDFVPCLHVPQWPFGEFLARHRETGFLPLPARRNICEFGVHLVPVGLPESATECFEWRVSFCREEEKAFGHLSPVQRAVPDTVQRLRSRLRDDGAATPPRSYHVRTAVLWLAQDQPSDRWTGVSAGVNMVLDWLEQHLADGRLPCFFSGSINLVAGFSRAELESLIAAVRLVRRQATYLLLACCRERYDLDTLLEGGPEPLTERQLRLRLARQLVLQAVSDGVRYRQTAPCWEHWMRCHVPTLSRLTQPLQWLHRGSDSGSYRQQCRLLQALSVAPADLVAGMRLTSLGGDMFTWPVTPLLALLTESDLEFLLGDPAAAAAWCRRQLRLPPAERPAGLTAELDTPRGRAELLLQPELLLRAVSEAVPGRRAAWQRLDRETEEHWRGVHRPPPTYQQCREALEALLSRDLETTLRSRLPELSGPAAAAVARDWRRRLQHLQVGDRLRRKYITFTSLLADRWETRWDEPLDRSAQDRDPAQ